MMAANAFVQAGLAIGGRLATVQRPAPQPQEDIAYRVLRPGENPKLGLQAKNPSATYTVDGHVLNGSKPGFKSQFISVTRDRRVAEEWAAKTGGRTVGIDLNSVKAPKHDLSTLKGRLENYPGPTAWNYAAKSSEVLIEGPVPPGAIFDLLH